MTIDTFMRSQGFSSQFGYIGEIQKKQFSERLSKLPNIRKIIEIGFNAGHSAECFFESCKNLEIFVSFDINAYPYTRPAAEHFQKLHPNRFFFIEGDSQIQVPQFAKHSPNEKFDLIYIDGNHDFEYVLGDILNAKLLAHPETILWIDDSDLRGVNQAIVFSETLGFIQTEKMFAPKDIAEPQRTWVEAKFKW